MKKIILLLLLTPTISTRGIAQDSASRRIPEDSLYFSKTFLNLSLDSYLQPGQSVTLSPAVSFRYNHIYSELRYNYEALHTGTVAGGYELEGGNKTWYSVTPMFGFSFGNYVGLSPGLNTAFGTGNFVLTLDGEYSISFTDSVSNLFLLWSGAYYAFTPWFFSGITLQRSRIFSPMNDVDAGVALGFAPGAFEIIFQANRFWDSARYFQLGVSYFLNPEKSDRKHGATPTAVPSAPRGN